MIDNQPQNTIPEFQESATTELKTDNTESKKKNNYIIGAVLIAVLLIGLVTAYLLGQQNQDIRQQASSCVEQCPGSDGVLRSCHPPESDGSSNDSGCSAGFTGRVKTCGPAITEYCCNGTGWTTDMTACPPTPSPSPTPTPTPSPSPSPTPTPSPSPTPTPTPSPSVSPSPSPSVSPSPSPSVSPSPSPSVSPSPTPTITYSCNSNCTTNSQCQTADFNYVCYQSKCRLDSNPTSDQCAATTSTTTQPDLPAELPVSGSEDVVKWFKAGLGVLGIGAALLFLL
jgi:hypothetical protein